MLLRSGQSLADYWSFFRSRLQGLGRLQVGAPADVCLFDPEVHWQVHPKQLLSQGKHTPFIGYELQGRVSHTIVSGRLAFSRAA